MSARIPTEFDAFVRAYEDDENFHYRRYVEAPSFFEALGDITGQSVLDLGCGAGLYTRRLAQRGAARVVGLDISPNMIDYARAREAEEPRGIQYVLDDASNAGRLGPFDVVTGVYVLPYAQTLEKLRAMCRGAHDALRPGGRFITVVVNPEAHFARKDFYRKYGFTLVPLRPEHAGLEHLPDGAPVRLVSYILDKRIDVTPYCWSHETLTSVLKEVGFSQVRWRAVEVSPEGSAAFGLDYWRDILESPPAVPLACVK
ncbi:class I SAM-dependent methyltransferase [Vitiosangium sp. GDMCC 1.1324]|uniref:class I SAM-dependent methyltransferase n=1 Tax=Vitiosangium sp. (strain GDMCC 1.1324) TaxID=2138576 RepID=UPI000D348D8C|nr:class I SAM-dependent methyltransferase [Vitiosangium sp. GDMCC 1.1324]PTL82248.1 class I SAM-dependent methyltransferase [Vitiosangium sp. GDMCC 1.1324]